MKYLVPLIITLFVLPLVFAASTFPKPIGFVNDFANILPDRAQYEQGLSDYEKNTTIEVAVVTLDNLPPDQTLATYAVELFQDWGIGKKGEDNGLLILMVKNGTTGNRLRIEVGYGLQGYITGAEAGRVLDDALPYYTKGDYQGALDTILFGLSDQLQDYVPGQQPHQYVTGPWEDFLIGFLGSIQTWIFLIFIIIFIVSAALSTRCPYCFGPLKCSDDGCVCKKCGRKISRRKRYAPVIVGGFGGGGGGGFGGFGGGGSGGGGAGR